MNVSDRISHITNWISNYAKSNSNKTFELVVGVSGGIDSAVTSTLCAITGIRTHAVSMPIKQNPNQHDLSLIHINWLKKKYDNICTYIIDLDEVFKIFQKTMNEFDSELAFANSRARLRMVTLYQIAQNYKALVVGTGNKVEDFGIGFFTKYGDGGVDISPIADCSKSQVWEMGKELGLNNEIIKAKPTDGLWDDSRNDEDQIGLSYQQIEDAMENEKSPFYEKFKKIRTHNLHKMKPIPICILPKNS
jgi:NAD+ synthase